MNKQNIFSAVLGAAVLVLFILHFSGQKNDKGSVEGEQINQQEIKDTIAQVPEIPAVDSVAQQASKASSIAYFNVADLIEKCPRLQAIQQQAATSEQRVLASAQDKNVKYQNWAIEKNKELEDYARKKMLVPSIQEAAAREQAMLQQTMSEELRKEEEALIKLKTRLMKEQTELVQSAVDALNKVQKWDYILVDDPTTRLVIPFNKENDLTDDLAKIINGK